MYGELMRIETLVERVAELKEANRRLQTLNAELVRDIEEAKRATVWLTWDGVRSGRDSITRTNG